MLLPASAHRRVVHRVVLALHGGGGLVQQTPQDPDALLESLDALGRWTEADAVLLVLVLLPARPTPSSSRPPLTWSVVEAQFATTAGWR